MPPLTGTSFAINNLLGAVQQAQGPAGQLNRMRTTAMQDELNQTIALRRFANSFDYTQPNAPLEFLKGAAVRDPGMITPLINLAERQRLDEINMERRGQLADIMTPYVPEGFDRPEIASIQTEALRRGIEEPRFLTPLEEPNALDFYEAETRRRAANKRPAGSETALLNNAQKIRQDLIERSVPVEIADAYTNYYVQSGGRFNEAILGEYATGELYKPTTDERDRIENAIINNPEVQALAIEEGLFTEETKPTTGLFGVNWNKKNDTVTPTPQKEAVLSELASGKYRGRLSPEVQKMIDERNRMVGRTPNQKKKIEWAE